MKKIILLLAFLFLCKYSLSQNSGLRYYLPEEVINEIENYFLTQKCDTCDYYGEIETFYDTVIFSLYLDPNLQIEDSAIVSESLFPPTPNIKYLIQRSNRFIQIGKKRLPIILREDFFLSDFLHIVLPDGSQVRTTFSERILLYIMYVRKSWGKGQIIAIE